MTTEPTRVKPATNRMTTRYQPLPTLYKTLHSQGLTALRILLHYQCRDFAALPGEHQMTQNQFLALCMKYAIDPSLALENEALREALRDRDVNEVERILREEF
jgi:hypothetical protein